MQLDKLQRTLILGLYYIDKMRNIESFVKKFNTYFHTSISAQTILFELAKYKNIDPANNRALNSQDKLHKQIWNDYIELDRLVELKDLYKRFMMGEFAEQLSVNVGNDYEEIDDFLNTNIIDVPVAKPIRMQDRDTYNYPRSKQVVINALNAANYKCEANCSTELFLRKNGYIWYTEGHHLIPLEYQDDFDYSLDIEANVVSLCPNCHKLLHYGYNKEEILKSLYEDRIDRLIKCNIYVDFASLLLMYR